MRDEKGNLVEYIIPAAILALTLGLSVLKMANVNIFGTFWAASIDGKVENNNAISISKISSPSTVWGSSGKQTGSSIMNNNATQVNCSGNFCSVTINNMTLKKIPNNFNQIVQASGTSGGTDSLIAILKEIAQNLKDQGLLSESKQIEDLANLGHNIARIEEQIETDIKSCNSDKICLNNLLISGNFTEPPGFNKAVGQLPGNLLYNDAKYLVELGTARAVLDGNVPYNYSFVQEDNPAIQYMQKYDEIMSASTIDSSVKSMLSQLTWTIGSIAEDFNDNVWAVGHAQTFDGTIKEGYIRDPLSGKGSQPALDFTQTTTLESFNSYSAETITDLSSALSCAYGSAEDTGKTCNGKSS